MTAEALTSFDRWQCRHPVLGVPVAVAKKFIDDDAAGLGVQMAYWGFFSVFSLLLAFVSLLGFAFHSDPAFQERIVDSTLRLMPVIGPQISGHIGSDGQRVRTHDRSRRSNLDRPGGDAGGRQRA